MTKPMDEIVEVMARGMDIGWEDPVAAARAAIAALAEAGYVVVPREPVAELHTGFEQAMRACGEIAYEGPEVDDLWRFMIAALQGRRLL